VVSLAAAQTNVTSLLATDIKIGEDDQTKIDFEDANTINFYANNAKEVVLAENSLSPGTSDGTALGTTSLMWSDLFVASGSVINFNNGDVTLTHSSNTLTVAGGTLAAAAITGTTIDASTDFTIGGTVITDGVITDSSGLQLAANLDIDGTAKISGTLTLDGTHASDEYISTNADTTFGRGATDSLQLGGRNILLTASDDLILRAGAATGGVDAIRMYAGSAATGATDFQLLIDDTQVDLNGTILSNVGASGNTWSNNAITVGNANAVISSGGDLEFSPVDVLRLKLNDGGEYVEWQGGTPAKVTTSMTSGRLAEFALEAQNVAASATIDVVTFNSASAFANQKGVVIDGWAQDGTSAIYFRLVASRRYGGDTTIVLLEQEEFNTTAWMAVGDWTIADVSGDDVTLSYTNNESATVAIQLKGTVFG